MAAVTDQQRIENLQSHLKTADEENGKLRHLLSQVLPISLESNISNWCYVCGYACDVLSGRCKWRESVLEEAEELEIEVE